MKQKALCLLVPFLLLALLVGCQGTEQTKTERSIDSLRSFKHYNIDVTAAETESTIYFVTHLGSPYIMYVDKATGITGPLCAKPECMHNDKTCNAYVPDSTGGLFAADDRLYWVGLGPVSDFNVPVYCLALDGTGLLETIHLDSKLIPTKIYNSYYIFHDDTLFISMTTVDVENGVDVAYYYVCAFSLHSEEEPTVILREKAKNSILSTISLQYYKGYLYFIMDDYCDSSEHKDGDPLLYDFHLRRWNEATGEIETLYEESAAPLQDSVELWVTDDGVYCNRNRGMNESNIFFYSFADKTCKEIGNTGVAIGLVGIGDDLTTSCKIAEGQDGMYDLTVGIKNFAGDELLHDTYSIDLGEMTPFSGQFQFIGRDEAYAYYAAVKRDGIYDEEGKFQGQNIYTAIVSVALDGSGARVLCINKSAHMVERY